MVGVKYIASVSFGKDTLAMLLRLIEEDWQLDSANTNHVYKLGSIEITYHGCEWRSDSKVAHESVTGR